MKQPQSLSDLCSIDGGWRNQNSSCQTRQSLTFYTTCVMWCDDRLHFWACMIECLIFKWPTFWFFQKHGALQFRFWHLMPFWHSMLYLAFNAWNGIQCQKWNVLLYCIENVSITMPTGIKCQNPHQMLKSALYAKQGIVCQIRHLCHWMSRTVSSDMIQFVLAYVTAHAPHCC